MSGILVEPLKRFKKIKLIKEKKLQRGSKIFFRKFPFEKKKKISICVCNQLFREMIPMK